MVRRLQLLWNSRCWSAALCVVLVMSLDVNAQAQGRGPHYEHAGALPPGSVGARQLLRGGPLAGYFQPVELKGPVGSKISLALENQFTAPLAGPIKTGLLIAPVYRFKVTDIPGSPGVEVYPTVEVVNRTYPPRGQEFQHPIPIEFTAEELQLAAQGKFVTRIVYVENPHAALPQAIKEQPYFEIAPGQDPLAVADRLGRPVAILRMGSRLPDPNLGPDERFLYGSPAMLVPHEILLKVYSQGLPHTGVTVPAEPALLPNQTEISERTISVQQVVR